MAFILLIYATCIPNLAGAACLINSKHHYSYLSLSTSSSSMMSIVSAEPLEQALHDRVPVIHHSDQGVQYLSNAYLSKLKAHAIQISVARRGCPWENGYAERLIRTLKEEEVYLNDYAHITEARERIGHFITQVYHQKRPHAALGYSTPMEFQMETFS